MLSRRDLLKRSGISLTAVGVLAHWPELARAAVASDGLWSQTVSDVYVSAANAVSQVPGSGLEKDRNGTYADAFRKWYEQQDLPRRQQITAVFDYLDTATSPSFSTQPGDQALGTLREWAQALTVSERGWLDAAKAQAPSDPPRRSKSQVLIDFAAEGDRLNARRADLAAKYGTQAVSGNALTPTQWHPSPPDAPQPQPLDAEEDKRRYVAGQVVALLAVVAPTAEGEPRQLHARAVAPATQNQPLPKAPTPPPTP